MGKLTCTIKLALYYETVATQGDRRYFRNTKLMTMTMTMTNVLLNINTYSD